MHHVAGAQRRGLDRRHLGDGDVRDHAHPGRGGLEVRHRRRRPPPEAHVDRAEHRRQRPAVHRRERARRGIRRLQPQTPAHPPAVARGADETFQPGDLRRHLGRRRRQHLAHRTGLGHAPALDDQQAVGEGGGIHRVMRHRDRRHPREAFPQHRRISDAVTASRATRGSSNSTTSGSAASARATATAAARLPTIARGGGPPRPEAPRARATRRRRSGRRMPSPRQPADRRRRSRAR